MTSRKQPGVAFWATVVVVMVLVLYVLSAGPFVWLWSRDALPEWVVKAGVIYAPLEWLVQEGPEPISRALKWYADLWR